MSTVLVTLVVGIFEIGMAWRDHQSLTMSARNGARVGSQLGTAAQADNQILRAIQAGLGDQTSDITRIVVFEAGATGAMPTACSTAVAGYVGAANCNVYDASALSNLNSGSLWGSGTSCGLKDANWCSATERRDDQTTATYLGVYVELERQYLTRLFGGGTHTMTETAVMRIEPGQ